MMFYEPYKGKKRRERERPARRGGCLGRLVWFACKLAFRLLLLVAVLALIAYALPPGVFQVEPEADLGITSGLPGTHTNILLLGVDKLSDNAQRSDTIIICSVGYNDLKLTSILRDTVVEIPGHGKDRINAAFAYGGAELAMHTVNRNFGMNISRYVVADFYTLARLVDAVGGVDLAISQAECEQINYNNRSLIGQNALEDLLGYVPERLETYSQDGEQTVHLDGTQALAYARIRHIDSDFARTFRQRKLLSALSASVKRNLANPMLYVRVIRTLSTQLETNLGAVEIASLGAKALFSGEIGQLRLPADGTYQDTGGKIHVQLDANVQALRSFIYG